MSRRVWLLCLALPLAGFAVPARAELIVTIESTSVSAGGTGTLNVYLTSTASPSTPDMINQAGFELQITNNGVDGTQLAFGSQSFGYLNNSAYVFYGDSNDYQSSTPGGYNSTTVYPNDSFIGLDYTASGNPVSISSSTSYLLASLTITASTLSPPGVGDSFAVSLVPTSGNGSLFAGTNTFFDTFVNGTETSYTSYMSTSGTVTITGASIPEPASIISGMTAVVLLAGWHGARRLRRWDCEACLRG